MARLAIDDAAWTSRWRTRSTGEKALLAGGLLTLAVAGPQPAAGVCAGVSALVAALGGARVDPRLLLRAARGPALFVLVGLVGVVVSLGTADASAVWQWGPLWVAEPSLQRGLEVAARSLGSVAALLLLTTTTPVPAVLDGLRRLRVPEVMVDIAGVVYRLLFLLLDTQSAVRESQAARLGYADRRAAYRSFGVLGAAVLVRALERARRLEDGLTGRGYDGSLAVVSPTAPVRRVFVGLTVALLAVLTLASALWTGWLG